MTDVETKTLNSLKLLALDINSTIDEKTLKQAYLHQAKVYHPDTCQNEMYKDGKMFASIKEAYDFLSKDINVTIENIHNIQNPNNKTYNYQSEYNYNEANNSFYNQNFYDQFKYYQATPIKIIDRPSLFSLLLCLIMPFMGFIMYVTTKRIMPKASKWYCLASILGVLLTIGIRFL